MRTTRVARFDGPGSKMSLVDVQLPGSLARGEVLVEVRACTLCASDLHTIAGRRPFSTPMVLGHEVVGDVVAAGEGASVEVGERVVWAVVRPCGQCRPCRRGSPASCTSRFKYGHEPFDVAPLSGGLGGHCLLESGTAIEHVPEGVSDAVAATAMCAGATAMATLRVGEVREGDDVVVFGAGLLGLSAAAGAWRAGARTVAVVDVDPRRAERALAFGATDVLLADGSLSEGLRALQSRGFDVALELSGATSAAEAGLDALAVGGRLVLAGAVMPVRDLALNPEHLVRLRASVRGVHNYRPRDLAEALRLLEENQHPFDDLIAPAVDLEQLARGILGAAGDGLRQLVRP